MCNCVCIDELTDVCLYIHVCMPIYEKLYRCKTLKPVKLVGLLQSSQQGQDFPHLGNTQDCFLLQVTSKRGLIYLKMTCGITLPWRPAPGKIFQPRVPKNSPSPCTPSPCPVCCVAGSVSSTHSAYTHTPPGQKDHNWLWSHPLFLSHLSCLLLLFTYFHILWQICSYCNPTALFRELLPATIWRSLFNVAQ